MMVLRRPGRVRVAALFLSVAIAFVAAVAKAGRYTPEGPHVTVLAPGARLHLRLATLVGESLALACVHQLPRHGGMLLSVYDSGHPGLFNPRYLYVHVDEVAVDSSGRVIADLLDMPLRNDRADRGRPVGFVAKARYIIDVPAGEAVNDGLIPGQRVHIIADPKTLRAERDHSVPAPAPCELPTKQPGEASPPPAS